MSLTRRTWIVTMRRYLVVALLGTFAAIVSSSSACGAEPASAETLPTLTPEEVVWKPLPFEAQTEYDELSSKYDQVFNEGKIAEELELTRRICALLIRHRSPLYVHTTMWKQNYEEVEKLHRLPLEDQAAVQAARVSIKKCPALAQNKVQALKQAQEASSLLREKLGDDSYSCLLAQQMICMYSPTYDETAWRDCTDAYCRHYGKLHRSYASCVMTHGQKLAWHDQYVQALPHFEEAHIILEKIQYKNNSDFGLNCSWLAFTYFKLGRVEDAEQAAYQAQSNFRTGKQKAHGQIYLMCELLGAIYTTQGDTDSAVYCFQVADKAPNEDRLTVRPETKTMLLKYYIQALRAERRDEEATIKEEELRQLQASVQEQEKEKKQGE